MGHHRGAHEKRLQRHCGSEALGRQGFLSSASSTLCLAVLSGLVTCGGGRGPSSQLRTPNQPELWYYHHSYLASDDAVDKSRQLISRAIAAGYTGLVLWDSGLNYLGNESWPIENEDRIRDTLRYAAKKGLKVVAAPAIYGYSNDVLEADPNWAESQRVVGSQFIVTRSGHFMVLKSHANLLANPGFEEGRQNWFDTGDQGIDISQDKFGGKLSGVVTNAPGNGRFRQTFPVEPWHQYHVRLFYKSANFHGAPMISVFSGETTDQILVNASFDANGSRKWTELDYIFNSGENTSAQMYFGVWGGSTGSIWFDDLTVEETAFVYLTRRAGAPLRIYAPGQPEHAYREGSDVERITDPRLQEPKAFTDDYHAPPFVRLPKGTRLKPGDVVAIDYYAANPVPGLHSVSMCMTDPATFQWLGRNARSLNHVLPKGGGIVLGYDEIRQANSCESCRRKKVTAGQLLAWSVGETISLYNKVDSERPLYIWSDMFDPHHNARDNYFHVEGDLSGSWEGIPANVAILNWNLEHLHESLQWFAGLDSRQPVAHSQIIAGYYDSGNGPKAATDELQAAHGVPGLQGLMYTTWGDDYEQLEQFATTVKANWPAYLASLK